MQFSALLVSGGLWRASPKYKTRPGKRNAPREARVRRRNSLGKRNANVPRKNRKKRERFRMPTPKRSTERCPLSGESDVGERKGLFEALTQSYKETKIW